MAKEGTDKPGQVPVVGRAAVRPRQMDEATFRKTTERILKTHESLFRRLAEYERSERR